MDTAFDLSNFSMFMCALLLVVPFLGSWILKLGITRSLTVSTLRMSVQLLLIGFFLEYLFVKENWLLNLLWFFVMIMVAVLSVLKNSNLRIVVYAVPLLVAFLLANLLIVIYFNAFVVQLDTVFSAKYLIAIGGMILGNSLRANIVGIGDFYKSLQKEEKLYLYKLSLGASQYEALLPFVRKSFVHALGPSIASMATMGIVSLPGMMTGQILGGSVPLVAIKYQIAIMVAILASTVLSIVLSLLFTIRYSFDAYGVLKKKGFKDS